MQKLNNINFLVISLTEALDRRAQVDRQFASLGCTFLYLDAVDGRKLDSTPEEYAADARQLRYGYDLSDGEIGCFLSHRKAWKYCFEKQINIVVFEDDVLMERPFLNVLKEIDELDIEFDCLRLSGLTERAASRILITKVGGYSIVEELRDPGGAGAYLLKPSGARKLLNASKRFYEPVDNFMENRLKNKLIFLALVPYPVKQNTLPSTIVDRLGFEKSRRHRIRRLAFRTLSDMKRIFWAVGQYFRSIKPKSRSK